MRVMLVNMPWASLDTPSLALGILHALVSAQGLDVETVSTNLEFYDWAAEVVGLTVEEYDFFANRAYFEGYGDWVFSSALYDDPAWRVAEFHEHMAPRLGERLAELSLRLHELVPRFVAELATGIAATEPDVVGFTTTFQQNTAALAVARQVKLRLPGVVTVFGGANCDGVQGEALHRNFPQVDYVVRGEAEQVFPQLLDALRGCLDPDAVAGLCRREVDGTVKVNAMSARPLAPRQLHAPDFEPYFTRVEKSSARPYIEPKLVLEGSRGCWWGEKHHCTFCGLNGSSMKFRSKAPEAFLQEIISQSRRHQVLDVVMVDNILDMEYVRSLLPKLAELGTDYRFHYEIKSNLRYRQLKTLADAGLVQVQPGIESLSTRVLKLMDKGVTGCQNVRHLRDAQSAGVWAAWNYLYGFPGESESDYTAVLCQLPALHHLTPPDAATRIAIERFSPYFNRPELGFAELQPAAHYARTYDLPESELHDLAYLFDAPQAGITAAVAERLDEAVALWRDAHRFSRLTRHDLGGRIVLVNQRAGFDWASRQIVDPVEVAMFRLLEDPRSVQSLVRRLTAQLRTPVPEARVTDLLADWCGAGIVFEDADRFVHVVPLATNGELTRVLAFAPDLTQDFAPMTAESEEGGL